MDCGDFKKELCRLVTAHWEEEHPFKVSAEMDSHAGRCEECAGSLRTTRSIIELNKSSVEPPPFLASRIENRLKDVRVKTTHVWWILAPALGSLLLIFGIGLLISPFSTRDGGLVRVDFTLTAPEVSRVFVVGDWNSWDPKAHPLSDKDGDGVWEGTIRLQAGKEYRYQFHIDGKDWIADPESPLKIHDGFGGWNSIIQL